MRLLILQISDIHFRATGNPVTQRLPQLLAAALSFAPAPNACLLLITGDIAWSGEPAEFSGGLDFLKALCARLREQFGPSNLYIEMVPGNHDCFLPKAEVEIRRTIINGARAGLSANPPDSGFTDNLLASQANFYAFYEQLTARRIGGNERIARTVTIGLAGRSIQVIALNTALLSQRSETPGSLYLPSALLREVTAPAPDSDLTVTIYHHPDNWLEPSFRRDFLGLTEAASHLIFTGHEHQQENYWKEASSGAETAYIQADPLQDELQPLRSGFNAVVINFQDSSQRYSHYRWKVDRYSALVDGQIHQLAITSKRGLAFEVTPDFLRKLERDDFGFTHATAGPLDLSDVFIYPPLFFLEPGAKKAKPILGSEALAFLLTQTSVYLRGEGRFGKTSLLKTVYLDLARAHGTVPLFLTGSDLTSSDPERLFSLIWSLVRSQYGNDEVERYKQLEPGRRIILIDDIDRTRVKDGARKAILKLLRKFAGRIIASSSELPSLGEYGSHLPEDEQVFTSLAHIRELPPTARSRIIEKWLALNPKASEDEASFVRELEQEQRLMTDLIKKRALPSLPYLVLGILQVRQHRTEEVGDPGSFGFLFQKLVIDALAKTNEPRKLIARKEGILRRLAFRMFLSREQLAAASDFSAAVEEFRNEIQVRVDEAAILKDLLDARVLVLADGVLSFTHSYYYHFFLARQLMDEVDSEKPERARQILADMVSKPLLRDSQLTLIFYLFFKKRDPVIDDLIRAADAIFPTEPLATLYEDVSFLETVAPTLQASAVDEQVDVAEERIKRLQIEDKEEQENIQSSEEGETQIAESYNELLNIETKAKFAQSRMESLGQIVRSYPDSLDGKKKIQILECVFRLGLRTLHVSLGEMQKAESTFEGLLATIEESTNSDENLQELTRKLSALLSRLVALFTKLLCSTALLQMSQAVGANEIEDAYDAAILSMGDTCATALLRMALTLDHSEGFPLAAVRALKKRFDKESRMASLVLNDLVQRHTRIFVYKPDMLRKIAGAIQVNTTELVAYAGKKPLTLQGE